MTHTYAKKGTFRAYLYVAQQQQYGGVRYQTYADVNPASATGVAGLAK